MSDLAIAASKNALAQAGVDGKDIGMVSYLRCAQPHLGLPNKHAATLMHFYSPHVVTRSARSWARKVARYI